MNCKDIVASILEAVALVCSDSMALDIWKTKTNITIIHAAIFKVSKIDNVLEISVDVKKALPKNLEKFLADKIESAL